MVSLFTETAKPHCMANKPFFITEAMPVPYCSSLLGGSASGRKHSLVAYFLSCSNCSFVQAEPNEGNCIVSRICVVSALHQVHLDTIKTDLPLQLANRNIDAEYRITFGVYIGLCRIWIFGEYLLFGDIPCSKAYYVPISVMNRDHYAIAVEIVDIAFSPHFA